MSDKLQAVRGMNDLLPENIGDWHRVERALREVGWEYGYQEIRTPMVERAELFQQAIGEATDIVEKEMYTFADEGGKHLALRPEATAATVRACNQHGLVHNRQQRLWYMGAMFRRERPQKGRYRQFHQFGIEAFGWRGPDIDAEVIHIAARIWKKLTLDAPKLEINTLGSPQISATYRDALRAYFAKRKDELDADGKRRLDKNPLRLLDSKAQAMQPLIEDAPSILDYLDDSARAHFDGVCDSLARGGVEFRINPRLVRGLDYYTGTVFEWLGGQGAQNAVCAGGRYDRLVESRGGKPCAAIGFALGLERLVELTRTAAGAHNTAGIDAYVAHVGDAYNAPPQAVTIAEKLRDAGLRVAMHCGGGKLDKQLKRADASGARLAIIGGLDELPAEVVQVKDLRDGAQRECAVDELAAACRAVLGG